MAGEAPALARAAWAAWTEEVAQPLADSGEAWEALPVVHWEWVLLILLVAAFVLGNPVVPGGGALGEEFPVEACLPVASLPGEACQVVQNLAASFL